MKITVVILVFIGMVAAVATSVLVGALRVPGGEAIAAAPQTEPEVSVLLAAVDLNAAEVVTEGSLEVVTVLRSEAPEGAIRNPAQVVGRVLIVPMVKGQPFTEAAFARSGSGYEMATKVLPAGMRAMGIQVTEATGLDTLLYPGAVVDVMGSFRTSEGAMSGEFVSAVLLQAVQVLAVADRSVVSGAPDQDDRGRGSGGRRTVTLMVDPRQAETLQLAVAHGASMSLVLRNPLDHLIEPAHGMAMSDLSRVYARLAPKVEDVDLEEDEEPAPRLTLEELRAMLAELEKDKPAPEPERYEENSSKQIEILRGRDRETVEFKEETNSQVEASSRRAD